MKSHILLNKKFNVKRFFYDLNQIQYLLIDRLRLDKTYLKRNGMFSILLIVCILIQGCNSKTDDYEVLSDEAPPSHFYQTQENKTNNHLKKAVPLADAGVPISVDSENRYQKINNKEPQQSNFYRRVNPFALLPHEQERFQLSKANDIIVKLGGFLPLSQKIQEDIIRQQIKPEIPLEFENQPQRELVGVIMNQGIIGLIKMEDNKVYSVKPGSKIPHFDWFLYKLDLNRAVLRRAGNKMPKEVVVYTAQQGKKPLSEELQPNIRIDSSQKIHLDSKGHLKDLSEPFFNIEKKPLPQLEKSDSSSLNTTKIDAKSSQLELSKPPGDF